MSRHSGIRPSFLLAGVALLVLAGPVRAQQMRYATAARQYHGETMLRARIEFAAGSLSVSASSSDMLYDLRLTYDAERFEPLTRYDAETGRAVLGLESAGGGGLRVSSRRQLEQHAELALSPKVALDLEATLGASEAELDLGGLRLSRATIATAASKTTLRFSRPNPATCDSLDLNAGAAEFTTESLGNSRCRQISFQGGVGDVGLDLTGAWREDAQVRIKLALGGLRLRLPRDMGVAIHLDRFLASFNPAGFVKEGNRYLSQGYAAHPHHLDITLTSAVGDIRVMWGH